MNDDHRKDVALRLKAGLWLTGRSGTPGTKEDPVVAQTTAELAEHELLVQNDISRSKLDEILRLRRDAKPMELRVIAEALGVPSTFFAVETPIWQARSDGQARDLADALETIRSLAEQLQLERLTK